MGRISSEGAVSLFMVLVVFISVVFLIGIHRVQVHWVEIQAKQVRLERCTAKTASKMKSALEAIELSDQIVRGLRRSIQILIAASFFSFGSTASAILKLKKALQIASKTRDIAIGAYKATFVYNPLLPKLFGCPSNTARESITEFPYVKKCPAQKAGIASDRLIGACPLEWKASEKKSGSQKKQIIHKMQQHVISKAETYRLSVKFFIAPEGSCLVENSAQNFSQAIITKRGKKNGNWKLQWEPYGISICNMRSWASAL